MFEEGKSKRPPFVHSVIRNLNLFETRSLPALTRCYPRSFTFYVAPPNRSIRISCFELRIFAKGDRVDDARRPDDLGPEEFLGRKSSDLFVVAHLALLIYKLA